MAPAEKPAELSLLAKPAGRSAKLGNFLKPTERVLRSRLLQVGSFKRHKPPCSNEPGVCSWLRAQRYMFWLTARVAGTLIWALGRPRGGLLAARGGASRYRRASR